MQDPDVASQPKVQSLRIWVHPLHGEDISLGLTSTSTADERSWARYIICELQSIVSLF